MGATSRSVTAIRNADAGNHRTAVSHARRPGSGREIIEDRSESHIVKGIDPALLKEPEQPTGTRNLSMPEAWERQAGR